MSWKLVGRFEVKWRCAFDCRVPVHRFWKELCPVSILSQFCYTWPCLRNFNIQYKVQYKIKLRHLYFSLISLLPFPMGEYSGSGWNYRGGISFWLHGMLSNVTSSTFALVYMMYLCKYVLKYSYSSSHPPTHNTHTHTHARVHTNTWLWYPNCSVWRRRIYLSE
jgi:hypothetical protein